VILKKILIIDDEKDVLDVLTDIYKKDVWQIHTAENAKAALKMMRKEFFPVVLVDCNMPNMTGLEFIEEAQKLEKKSKIILMTGQPEYQILKKGMEGGIFYYVEKPFSNEVLLSVSQKAYLQLRDESENASDLKMLQHELDFVKKTLRRHEPRSSFRYKNLPVAFILIILSLFAVLVILIATV
jgi:DNA-binding NtrC family response regulator